MYSRKKKEQNSLLKIFLQRSRSAANFLQESILIAFDYLWKVLLSDKDFATP